MKMTNKDEGFYSVMGPVFGSRKVERVTGDRFYDDDTKTWYIDINNEGHPISVISVKAGGIKNIYSEEPEITVKTLSELKNIITVSIVPIIYKDIYSSAGYTIKSYTEGYLKILGGKYEED